MHGGTNPGAGLGNSNGLKHGNYSASAIALRREARALLRAWKGLSDKIG